MNNGSDLVIIPTNNKDENIILFKNKSNKTIDKDALVYFKIKYGNDDSIVEFKMDSTDILMYVFL